MLELNPMKNSSLVERFTRNGVPESCESGMPLQFRKMNVTLGTAAMIEDNNQGCGVNNNSLITCQLY